MFWELRKLAAKTVAALANTAVWDLPESGLLSGFLIKGSCATKSGVTNTIDDWRICDTLTDIDVTGDENVPIINLDGELARAKCFWDTKGLMHLDKVRDYATNTQLYKQWVGFGRYPRDEQFGLDLSRFNSSKIEITNDMVTANFGTPSLDVYGLFARGDDAPGFQGYIKSVNFREWTTVQDETKYIDLPPAGRLRRIMLQAVPTRSSGAAATGFTNPMYDIKYLAKSGNIVMFDDRFDTLVVMNHFDVGSVVLDYGEAYRPAAEIFSHGVGSRIGGAHGAYSVSNTASSTVPTLSDDTGFTMKVNSYDGDSKYCFIFPGYGPENTAILSHDFRGDGSDFLDLGLNKAVQLELHTRNASSSADGKNRVIVETVE